MSGEAEETVRRLRAMWGWSGWKQDDFLRAIGAEGRKDLMRVTGGPTRAEEHFLLRAAAIAQLPIDFALQGAQAFKRRELPELDDDARRRIEEVAAEIAQRRAATSPAEDAPKDLGGMAEDLRRHRRRGSRPTSEDDLGEDTG